MKKLGDRALKRARKLLSDPEHFTVHALARDNTGRRVAPDDPDATCFCALGALRRVTPEREWRAYDAAFVRLAHVAHQLGYDAISHLNDGAGHAAVLRAFDAAIEAPLSEL